MSTATAPAGTPVATPVARSPARTAVASSSTLNAPTIPEAISLAQRAMATIRTNFAWAVGYNLVGMALAVLGLMLIWGCK